MWRIILLGIALCLCAFAQTKKLYLKDGSYHLVREYQVLEDRIRYYSTERGDWEEIPKELVDLKKTEAEIVQRIEDEKKQAAILEAEDKFEKEQREEIERIPVNPGVYWVLDGKVQTLKQAEVKVNNNKRRSILKAITPIPIIAGKSTVEVDGETSQNLVAGDRPTFYFRLAEEERYAIVRLGKKKGVRIVEEWDIIPVSKEIMAKRDVIDIFRQQMQPGLFKIWPTKPLEPGEYAVIEFTEGQGNTQVWDFTLKPAATGGRP